MRTEEEIKACPFCGNKDIIVIEYPGNPYDHYQVYCNECQIQTASSKDKHKAIKQWNRRDYSILTEEVKE